jgi:AP-2 complex subunit alpha
MFDVMKKKSLHEAMIKIGAYVLSEFGYLIAADPGKSMIAQFNLIKSKLPDCSSLGRAILLTAFMKMTRHSSEVRAEAKKIFEQNKDHWDIEIQ